MVASQQQPILDHAIERVEDSSLRRLIAAEVEKLRGSRRFGLVFDRHLPEAARLAHHPIRKGTTVALRDESSRQTWTVTRLTGPDRTSALLSDGTSMPLRSLIPVRAFGEPVYPGLQSVARIERAPGAPWHTVINGENYHVLQALSSTHRGKVDVIYIDPPYNTGNDNWVYNDRYIDANDRTRSSKWLSFMERRLTLAKDLLKDTGVIFVSIDDNEQHRLRMLMDQVFGVANFVETIAVEMSTTSGPKVVNAQQGTIVKNVEFVHAYRKGPEFDQVGHTPLYDSITNWDTHYSLWLHDDGTLGNLPAEMQKDPLVAKDIAQLPLRGRQVFGVNNMDMLLAVSSATHDFVNANLNRIARTHRLPVACEGIGAPLRRHITVEAGGRNYILTQLANGTIQQVTPLSSNFRLSDDYKPRFGRTVIRGDLWKGFHQDMGNVAKEGAVVFKNGKKPIRLIKQLVRWANNSPDAVVLDFFGGSGTTTHAVMDMNADDGGQRQSIVVTNNEVGPKFAAQLRAKGLHPGDPEWETHGVFESVTRPRVETVITGVKPDGGKISDGMAANVEFFNLTYLDPGMVRRGMEFDAIAPLLWLSAGAADARIEASEEDDYLDPGMVRRGMEFDAPFGACIATPRAASHPTLPLWLSAHRGSRRTDRSERGRRLGAHRAIRRPLPHRRHRSVLEGRDRGDPRWSRPTHVLCGDRLRLGIRLRHITPPARRPRSALVRGLPHQLRDQHPGRLLKATPRLAPDRL